MLPPLTEAVAGQVLVNKLLHVSHKLSIPSLLIVTVLISTVLILAIKNVQSSPYPLLNGKKGFELLNTRPKKEFMAHAWDMISRQIKAAPDEIFRVIGEVGEIIVLPPKYAHELRNHRDLSFSQAAYRWYYGHLPGFEGFREGTTESQVMKLVARHQLTHQLTLVTKPVSEEAAAALRDIYTDDKNWHEVEIKPANLQLMARITSRIFLGEEMCRNPDWLRITATYTVQVFRAVEELRYFPTWLRDVVHWFLPQCTAARRMVQEARSLIEPLLETRRSKKTAAALKGEKCEYNDAIDWFEGLAREKQLQYDPATAQLSLSVASLYSTTDCFTQALLDIAAHSELIEPLREEIVQVVGKGGWVKHSLYNLKLMDSVLKESQRLKPIAMASMRRYTTNEITLSDGNVLPKNRFTVVSANQHWDAAFYENPEVFDGYRFLRRRQEGDKTKENLSQLVSTTPDHMGFGYGLHACPGRAFASEEIKIVLCHVLMKYDIKTVPGSDLTPRRFGLNMTVNPTAKVAIRRRDDIAII
ncbi:cytochrome P450 monooxygenase [Pseudovirgaria hyperparasitica]|uniref:Cytochrome P450 monooxygenase n=1 Tax=Pseudovirgaria hyperparasitica TaxID=470096 RepID=A0A6A6W276_9PEZI|nr:cytochrome P450 monooxygenase [Pseudovirgaria hyperparasitica]KAF2756146.1 cytochrome P450 monooxygenase [Pseudovirgaria hyperparasitica]